LKGESAPEEILKAVDIAMAGMNPMEWMEETDSLRRMAMEVVANKRIELAEKERQDLADRIIQALGKAMKK
jgi:hypothetical protein